MAISVGRGRSNVRFDGPLAAAGKEIEREIRDLLGPVLDECEREAIRVLRDEVYRNWPIRSTDKNPRGKSIQAFETELRLLPGQLIVEVIIRNRLNYVWYIKSTKKLSKPDAVRVRSPWQEHVRKPARVSLRRLRSDLPAMLSRHLDGVF